MTSSTSPVAVVTGANSGIGRAAALQLAQQGYRVFGTVRSIEKAAKLQARAQDLGVVIELIELDVASDSSVQLGFNDIFRTTDRIDVLVNNAGIGGNGVVEESTPQMFHDAFNVNVVGAVRCMQHVLPKMRAQRSGTIVNITSVAGVRPMGSSIAYSMTKAALNQMTRLMAKSHGPVRHNAVAPGLVETPWTKDWANQHAGVAAMAPLKRSATPDDCAEAVLALVRNKYVTGQIFVVDGGLTQVS